MNTEVEIASSADLAQLGRKMSESQPSFPLKLPKRRHPECPPERKCPTCESNREWERIYREKFEDPNYYCGAYLRQSSPQHNL